jgi:hypothetical protein
MLTNVLVSLPRFVWTALVVGSVVPLQDGITPSSIYPIYYKLLRAHSHSQPKEEAPHIQKLVNIGNRDLACFPHFRTSVKPLYTYIPMGTAKTFAATVSHHLLLILLPSFPMELIQELPPMQCK